MQHVMGTRPVDNYPPMAQLKTTLESLTVASVSKEINLYQVQMVLTNHVIQGGMS